MPSSEPPLPNSADLSAAGAGIAARSPFRLGPWEVVPSQLRLSDGADEIRLQQKEMALLLALCDAGEQPINAEGIRRGVWGDQAITDGVAKNLIWQLRRSLGETAQEPGLIETVPGVGYRLTVRPEALEDVPGSNDAAQDGRRPAASGHGHFRAIVGLGAVVLALALVLWTGGERHGDGGRSDKRVESGAIEEMSWRFKRPRPVTGLPGREAEIDLDPSGRHLLFSWAKQIYGQSDLYRFDLRDPNASPVQLTSSAAHSEVSGRFSPDGRRIAFIMFGAGDFVRIMVIPSFGGVAREIAVLSSASVPDLAWRSDGEALYLSWWPAGDPRAGDQGTSSPRGLDLQLLPLSTGVPEPVLEVASKSTWDRTPALSPDGGRLAFTRWTTPRRGEIRLLELASREQKTVTSISGRLGALAWLGGDLLLFTARLGGQSSSIYQVAAEADAEISLFAPTGGSFDVGEVTSAAGTIAFEQSEFDINIVRYDGLRGAGSGRPRAVVISDRSDLAPRLSPDGGRLVFLTDRSGGFELWLSEGGRSRKLPVEGVIPTSRPRWSPDGELLVLSVVRDGGQELVVIRPGEGPGNDHVEQITETPERELFPSWRPDGLALRFFVPDQLRGQLFEQELWEPASRRPLEAAAERSLALADGRLVFSNEEGLFVIDPGSEARRLDVDIDAFAWGNWDATEEGVYAVAVGSKVVRFHPFGDGVTEDVLELEHPAARYSLDVTPDGSTLFVAIVVRDTSRILTLERASNDGAEHGLSSEGTTP